MTRNALIRGGTIVTPSRSFRSNVLVRDGRIAAIGLDLEAPADGEVIDASGLHVLPGVIDPHSHLWEAGFMSDADFRDSTASAVAGGITTIVEMPLTTPEVLDVETFLGKAEIGRKTSHVDFALYGGVRPSNTADLEGMWKAGAVALKIFTCDTGCAMHGVIDDSALGNNAPCGSDVPKRFQLDGRKTRSLSTLCISTGMRRIEASEIKSPPMWP